MITLLQGPFRSGKTTRCLGLYRSLQAQGKTVVIAVPSRMERDTLLTRLLNTGAAAGNAVITLRELAEWASRPLPDKPAVLSDFESFLMVRMLFAELSGHFVYFQNVPPRSGIVRMVYSLLTDIRMESGLTELEQHSKGPKWQDLNLLANAYEKRLTQNGMSDLVRLFQRATQALRTAPLKVDALIIDGFFDFNMVQKAFIEALAVQITSLGGQIMITLPAGRSELLEKTARWATEKLGAERETLKTDPTLGDSFLAGQKPEPLPDSPAVEAIYSFGKPREAYHTIQKILQLVRFENYRYGDIAIILKQPDDTLPSLQTAARNAGIPLYSGRDTALTGNPAVLYLFKLCRIALTDRRLDGPALTGLASSTYTASPAVKRLGRLEKLLNTYFSGNHQDWLAEIDRQINWYQHLRAEKLLAEEEGGRESEQIGRTLLELKELRPLAENFLTTLFSLPQTLGPRELTEWLARILTITGFKNALLSKSAQDGRDYTAVQKWNQTLKSLSSTLKLLGRSSFERGELFSLLDELVRSVNYRYQYYPTDAVWVLTPSDCREQHFRAVFFLSLNEGEIPGRPPVSALTPGEKRSLNAFARRLILSDTDDLSTLERLECALVLSRATERLYLGYTPCGLDGSQILPSLYFQKLARWYGLNWRQNLSTPPAYLAPPSEIYNEHDLAMLAPDLPGAQKLPPVVSAGRMNSWLNRLSQVNQLASSRQTPQPGAPGMEFFGIIAPDNTPAFKKATEYLRERLQNARYSSSRLEQTGSCRHTSFYRNILGIYEEKRALPEIEARWKGLYYHLALKYYGEQTRQNTRLTPNEALAALSTACGRAEQELLASGGDNDLFEMEKHWCHQHLNCLVRDDAANRVYRAPESMEMPLDTTLTVDNSHTIPVTGSIDRLDLLAGSTDAYAVIDYKTGSTKHYRTDKALMPGQLFQGYLYARLCGRRVTEIAYYSIQDVKNRWNEVLPLTGKKNRETGEEALTITSFETIWNCKIQEISTLIRLTEAGNFSPFNDVRIYSDEIQSLYQLLNPGRKTLQAESDRKCNYCAYRSACRREPKLLSDF